MKTNKTLVIALLAAITSIANVYGQCTAPSFTIDLTSKTDTTWTLSQQTRGGVCCGSSNCVTFEVYTNPGSELISFDVTSPSPSGSAYYQVNCGTPVSIGTPLCIVGLASPFTITYCKPGGDHPNYVISAGTIVHASDDISIQKTNCIDTLFVTNVQTSSITWTSIYPGAQGAYDSYLSCTTGCTSTIVTPGTNPPAYVDYMVSGNPNISCGSFSRDTVRVYFVNNLTATITPPSAVICASSGTTVTLTANPSGGAVPYNYAWSTGPHTQSINVSAAGTYTVVVGDHTKCPKVTVTKTIGTLPEATFTYSASPYCKNTSNPSPSYTANGTAGTFSAAPAGLMFVSTATGEIDLSASTAGTYTITNSIAASGSCPGANATSTITINSYPTMTSANTATLCSNNMVNLALTSDISATYSWIAIDNVNISGESTSAQSSSTIDNTLINTSGASEEVIYTVTPTSTLSGSCPGAAQTVTVTVNPKDDASFTYSSSTNCQTGANPTTTITGLAGGTFSSTAGLVFVSTSTGEVNLAASTIGSYTITYTTNGTCLNTATFPINITTAPSADFSYTGTPYCQKSSNPTPIYGVGGSGGTFTANPAGLTFINNLTGEVDLGTSTPGTYTVTNTIAASGGCGVSTATTTITITEFKYAAFDFPSTPYCQNVSNPLPQFSGSSIAGTFSSTGGLIIDPSTGEVDLAGSTPGTYTVTNTVAAAGGCPQVDATSPITITALPIASFDYPATPYCQNASNPLPVFSGGGYAGTFSASDVYVHINSTTGEIDLPSSQAGSYVITNNFAAAGGCPAVSAAASIDITALPIGAFSYDGSPYCSSGGDIAPTVATGGTNGDYTVSPAGLNLDALSGSVTLGSSTAGTYTVTNTIAAADGCPVVVETATITVTQLPEATFSYATPYCQTASDPAPTYTGAGVAGVFSSTVGLTIDANSGTVDLSASTAGTYTVTNTIAAADGCPVVAETSEITITTMPLATFSYSASPYCQTAGDPNPVLAVGSSNGTYTSAAGLSIDANTGAIDLSASTAGTYTITNTIAAADGCPQTSTTDVIAITALPLAGFSYSSSEYCQNATDPDATLDPGAVAGIYSSGAGISFNTSTGTIDLAGSTTGTYTITNTIAAADGCPQVTADVTVSINPVATVAAGSSTTICSGNDYTLSGSIGGGASSLTWTTSGAGTFDDASSATAVYTPSAQDITDGSITLTITTDDPVGPCVSVNDNLTLSINPAATVAAGSPGTICGDSTFVLGGTIGGGASALTWSTSGTGTFDDASSSTAIYTPSAQDITNGSVTLTIATDDPIGPCTAQTDAVLLTLIPRDDPAFSYTSTAYCQSGTDPLPTISGTSGGIFSSPSSQLVIDPVSGQVTLASSALGNYTVNYVTSGACPDSSTVSFSVTTATSATFSFSAAQFCSSDADPLPVMGSGSTSGIYSSSAGLVMDSITGAIDLSASTPGTYSVTNHVDAMGGCASADDTQSITIDQAATVSADVDQNICYGTTTLLNGTFGGSATSIIWTGGNGTFTPDAQTGNATYTPTSADSTAGTITLTITTDDPAGVCNAVMAQMNIIIDQPAVANAGINQTICYGSVISLTGAVAGSASYASWTSDGTGVLTQDTLTQAGDYIPTSADSTAGAITFVLTTNDPTGVCNAVTDTMQVIIEQPATVDAGSDVAVCYGSTVDLSGAFGGSASTITWTGGNGTFTPDVQTGNATYTPTAADSTAGTITLTITTNDPAGVCNAVNDQLTITINPPAVVTAGIDVAICEGSTYSLSGQYSGGASSINWSSNGSGTFDDATLSNATYTPSTADLANGSVSLIITTDDPTGPCSAATDTMQLDIQPMPVANAGTDAAICAGNDLQLQGSNGGSSASVTWNTSGSGAFANSLSDTTTYMPSSTDIQNGSVTLTLTAVSAGVCPDVASTMQLTINQLDDPAFTYPAAMFCESVTQEIPDYVATNGGSFSISPSQLTINASTGAIDLVTGTTGTYTVTYLTNGVCPQQSSQTFDVVGAPVASAGTDVDMDCGSTSLTLDGTGSSNSAGITYLWSTNDGNILSGDNTTTPDIAQAGTYYITVSNQNTCFVTDTVVVSQGSITASFTPSTNSGPAALDVNFVNNSTGGGTYLWSFGDAGTSTDTNPDHQFTSAGSYTVYLTASLGSCVALDSTIIVVGDTIGILIPNVFTPNGDGINDELLIKTTGIKEMSGEIYNRWGTLMYTFEGVSSKWDGKTNANTDASDGTYFMILKAVDINDKVYEKQAYIALFR